VEKSILPGGRTVDVRATRSRYRSPVEDDQPRDPFLDDPADPASLIEDDEEAREPLSPVEREDVLADISDLEVYRALLEPRGVRGLVVDCDDCDEPHYFGWDLLRANLRHLLDEGRTRVHEPAFSPDPADYVSWDYARGYSDGALEAAESSTDDD
jgi:hypothetical protein